MADLVKKIKIKKQDGTFTDYIPIGAEAQNVSTSDGESVQLKLNKKPYYYNSVADMKADTKLKAGDMAVTLGYYEPNDGGNGEYRIISGTYTDDGGRYHLLNNNLFAELIIKEKINVKQYGAYGDNSHNDSSAIQKAINTNYSIIIPKATYLLENSVTIENKGNDSSFYIFDAEDASINYTGDDYAFILSGVRNATFKFGYVKSTVGGNIKLYAPNSGKYIQYVTFYFKILQCLSNEFSNVYAFQDTNAWINEIKWFGGRFIGSAGNNFHLYHNTPNNGMGGWSFYNIGFEGGVNCVKLESVIPEGSKSSMYGFAFYGCRYAESFTKLILAVGTGPIKNLVFYSPTLPHINYLSFNNKCTDWRFFGGAKDSVRIMNGVYTESIINNALSGGSRITGETDINEIRTPGNYIIQNYNIASECSNLPVSAPGRLIVENLTSTSTSPSTDEYQYIRQTYKLINGKTYERGISKSGENITFYEWRGLLSDQDLTNYYTFGEQPIDIPAESDLNDYLSPGAYSNTRAAQISTIENCPVTSPFDMRVYYFGNSSYYTCQELRTLSGHLYYRQCTTSIGFDEVQWTQKW